MKVPTNTCLPCGGQAKFNCTTVANHTVFDDSGMSVLEPGPGGQLWKIHTTNGTTEELYSTISEDFPASYELMYTEENDIEVVSGLLVCNTDSTWSGTTFQCIAYTPLDIGIRNNSSEPVTLEVGGECRI